MVLNGHSDAADLPSAPGHGFLQVGTDDLQRFKAAYVSGPYRRSQPAAAGLSNVRIHDYVSQHVPSTGTVVGSSIQGARSGSAMPSVRQPYSSRNASSAATHAPARGSARRGSTLCRDQGAHRTLSRRSG